jgi:hypothetical protein
MITNSTTSTSLEKTISKPPTDTVPMPMQKALATPISTAARKAPPRLPRTPHHCNDEGVGNDAEVELEVGRLAWDLQRAPSPASTAPTKNTDVKSPAWSTPSAPTISRSCVAARTSAPQRVRSSSSHRTPSTNGPIAISSRS